MFIVKCFLYVGEIYIKRRNNIYKPATFSLTQNSFSANVKRCCESLGMRLKYVVILPKYVFLQYVYEIILVRNWSISCMNCFLQLTFLTVAVHINV